MEQASTIGLDIAKRVFQAHGADRSGHVVLRKRLMRDKLLAGIVRLLRDGWLRLLRREAHN